MTKLYNRNLEIIRKVNPDIYKEMNENSSNFDINIYKTDQKLNYIIDNNYIKCFLHSIYNIEDEMKSQFKSCEDSEIIILFGLGMGFPVEYMKNNLDKISKVIIIEPALQVFEELMHQRDIYNLFYNINDLSIIINKDVDTTIKAIISEIKTNLNFSFVYNISYRTMFSDYYNEITEGILKNIRLTRSDILTATQQNDIWLINTFRNLQQNVVNVEHIISFFENKPVILVSAGPSLNKNMHLLNNVKNRAIIVAVGTAIRNLEKNGIKPHFRVAIDGTPGELKVFEDVDTSDGIPLIHSCKFYHKITAQYDSPKFMMISGYGRVAKYIFDKAKIKIENIDSGPSVANITLNFLTVANPSKIIIIGQDLCYSINKNDMYAKGAENKQNTIQAAYKNRQKVILEDIYGNKVYSDSLFLSMKYSMERTAETNNNIDIINATEGGLPLNNVNNFTLKEVIDKYLNVEIETDFMNYLKDINLNNIEADNKTKIYSVISNELKAEIQRIYEINEFRLKKLIKIKKHINKGLKINRIVDELNALEELDAQLRNYQFYSKVIGKELSYILRAIRTAFNYEGDDKLEGAKALQKILYSISLEIKKYCKISLELIDDMI